MIMICLDDEETKKVDQDRQRNGVGYLRVARDGSIRHVSIRDILLGDREAPMFSEQPRRTFE